MYMCTYYVFILHYIIVDQSDISSLVVPFNNLSRCWTGDCCVSNFESAHSDGTWTIWVKREGGGRREGGEREEGGFVCGRDGGKRRKGRNGG